MPQFIMTILANIPYIEGIQPDGRIRHYFFPNGKVLEINLDALPAL